MRLDLGHVQLEIEEGPNVNVQYRVTGPMVAAAMQEAERLKLDLAESDVGKLVQVALNAG